MSNAKLIIPNRLVFVWLGGRFPIANLVALRSARTACRPRELVLIADRLERDDPQLCELRYWSGFRVLRPRELLGRELPGWPQGAMSLYRSLDSPAARANLLRLAFLWSEGGVYLDTDTITLRDLAPLRRFEGFCGREVLALPREVAGSRRASTWLEAAARIAARRVCTLLPEPDRAFARIEHLYPQAVNNAVVGSAAGNPVLARALERCAELDRVERSKRFRLGTHLLQEVTGNQSSAHMQVLGPQAFYPLGPEVSVAWFRRGSASRVSEMLGRDTYVLHWYASLEARLEHSIDEEWIRSARDDVAFARLAWPWTSPGPTNSAAA